jgi:SPP1 family predicted phage head-tail adaptor
MSGAKVINNSEIFNTGIVNIYIRYRATLTDDMSVIFEGRKYKINFIKEIGHRQALMLNVEKMNE